jgi:hypothetical protein
MYLSDHSKNLISAEEKVAELIKQRDQLRAEVERLTHGTVAQFKDAFIGELAREVSLLIARAERAEAELAAALAGRDDLVADLNDACITLASACDDCDDYALLNTSSKITAVRDVLLQYIPPAALGGGLK